MKDVHGGKRVSDLFYQNNVSAKEIPKAILGPYGEKCHSAVVNLWDQRIGNLKDDTIRWFYGIIETCKLNKKQKMLRDE